MKTKQKIEISQPTKFSDLRCTDVTKFNHFKSSFDIKIEESKKLERFNLVLQNGNV